MRLSWLMIAATSVALATPAHAVIIDFSGSYAPTAKVSGDPSADVSPAKLSQATWLNFKYNDDALAWSVNTVFADDTSGVVPGTRFSMDADVGTTENGKLVFGSGSGAVNFATNWEKEWTYGNTSYAEVFNKVTNITRTNVSGGQSLDIVLSGTLYICRATSLDCDRQPVGGGLLLGTQKATATITAGQSGSGQSISASIVNYSAPGPLPGVGLFGSAALFGLLLSGKLRNLRG